MQVKICGITTQNQLDMLSEMPVDMIGFNFYDQSKRYVSDNLSIENCKKLKVGVFVNASLAILKKTTAQYQLDLLQLHGDEEREYCKSAQSIAKVIKVFRVDSKFEFSRVNDYSFCDYFLFDTYTEQYGGSGEKFDWKVLNNYQGKIQFYLSGGIGPTAVNALRDFKHPMFIGVDINSRFEISPGIKNLNEVSSFINELRK